MSLIIAEEGDQEWWGKRVLVSRLGILDLSRPRPDSVGMKSAFNAWKSGFRAGHSGFHNRDSQAERFVGNHGLAQAFIQDPAVDYSYGRGVVGSAIIGIGKSDQTNSELRMLALAAVRPHRSASGREDIINLIDRRYL